MFTLMSSTKSHCARPGCHVAKLVHYQPGSCGNYIDPDSDAGRAIRREEQTRVASSVIDSIALDRMLMAETITYMQGRIKEATQATQACLSAAKAGAPRTASRYAERALKALGGLGAS